MTGVPAAPALAALPFLGAASWGLLVPFMTFFGWLSLLILTAAGSVARVVGTRINITI